MLKWRHFRVTSTHLRSRDVISCHVTASCELQPCRKSNAQYMRFRSSTATSRWLPVKWRHFRITSCHLRSREVMSSRMTASSCELQPCRKSKAQYMLGFGLLQPFPGDFRSNDATSGSLPVTWCLVASFPVTWLPLQASYRPVGSQRTVYAFSAFYSHFQVNSRQMTSLPSHFQSPEVTWRHFLSRECLLLRATALYEVKRPVYAIFRPSTATCRQPPVKWRPFRSQRSRDVISCHVTAFSSELQTCR